MTTSTSSTTVAPEVVGRVAGGLAENLASVIRGKPEALRLTLVGLLSGHHLLLEDVPGVGKTLLAKALARSLGGTFRRVQGTPDLLPAELTGVSVFHKDTRRVGVPSRAAVRQRRAGRRDQPGDAPHPVGAARGDGGAPGHRRRRDVGPARAVLRRRHAEPGRARGHVPVGRGPARPVRPGRRARPPAPHRRARAAARRRRRRFARRAPSGVRARDAGRGDRRRPHRPLRAGSWRTTSSTCARRPATIPRCCSARSARASLTLLHAAKAHGALAGRNFVTPDDIQAVAVAALVPPADADGRHRPARRVGARPPHPRRGAGARRAT